MNTTTKRRAHAKRGNSKLSHTKRYAWAKKKHAINSAGSGHVRRADRRARQLRRDPEVCMGVRVRARTT